ncbi:MAG: ABC transporter ATP-binding protein [Bdellovibrionales bacterium]|nr:ABC transporter ATP-binding protein [Bdellovibrionales bacterium]
MAIVKFSDVSKSYTGLETAVKGVSFEVKAGEFAALAGPSGSGKTTILNLAAGLDTANSGTISLCDKALESLSRLDMARLRRQSVGFVFQAYNLFPVLTALENVMYPLALNHIPPRERRARAEASLKEVGLDGLGGRFPNEMSGGQQQRVAIARAIATNPKIVFADEPTANVDSTTADTLLELFQRLNKERGITFLFSSHDPNVLERAGRIIRVKDGQILNPEKVERQLKLVA